MVAAQSHPAVDRAVKKDCLYPVMHYYLNGTQKERRIKIEPTTIRCSDDR